MRRGLVLVLVSILPGLLAACGGTQEAALTAPGEVQTVEVTREVTVERTVVAGDGSARTREGPNRDVLPGPASPTGVDIERSVGETATLDNGNSVTVLSAQSGLSPQETVYDARDGMTFFVVEAEVCVSEAASEPAYFTPREFSVRISPTARRMASIPTKLPALRGSQVEPGACNRGFVTFQLGEEEEPRAVMFEGASSVRWELE